MTQNLRTEVAREIVRRWNAPQPEDFRPNGPAKITGSDARAMLRGEASTDQYRFAFKIAREFGLF